MKRLKKDREGEGKRKERKKKKLNKFKANSKGGRERIKDNFYLLKGEEGEGEEGSKRES